MKRTISHFSGYWLCAWVVAVLMLAGSLGVACVGFCGHGEEGSPDETDCLCVCPIHADVVSLDPSPAPTRLHTARQHHPAGEPTPTSEYVLGIDHPPEL